MSFGLIIRGNDEKTFITPNVTPVNFIKKITVNVPESRNKQKISVNTFIPDKYIVLPFIRAVNLRWRTASARLIQSNPINGYKTFIIDAVSDGFELEIYLFANFIPKLTNYGLEIYNKGQDLVYNNLCQPLEIKFCPKPDLYFFGQNGESKLRDMIMIEQGFPVAALCTSYGLKSFTIGANGGHLTYHIFSTAIGSQVGLHLLVYTSSDKYQYNYPQIGDIAYIDTRKYQ